MFSNIVESMKDNISSRLDTAADINNHNNNNYHSLFSRRPEYGISSLDTHESDYTMSTQTLSMLKSAVFAMNEGRDATLK